MNKKTTYRHMAGLLSALLLWMCTGCIRENRDGCEPDTCPVTFSFVYDHHLYEEDRFADQVEHIDLFIFDSNENLFQFHETARTAMSENHTIQHQLLPGDYTVVAWGNCHTGHFEYNNTETLRTLEMAMICINEQGEVTEKEPGNIFHAKNTFTVTKEGNTVPLSMVKNTNLVRLRLKGLTEEDRNQVADIFYSRIESNNTVYGYDNLVLSSEQVYYVPRAYYQEEEDEILEFQILRMLPHDRETRVTLRNREEVPRIANFQSRIIPRIEESFNNHSVRSTPVWPEDMSFEEYLERCDEFELVYQVHYREDSDGIVYIELTPWEDVRQPGEL